MIIRPHPVTACLLLLCLACGAPLRTPPAPPEAPAVGVEPQRRVFVPAAPKPTPPSAEEQASPAPTPPPPAAPPISTPPPAATAEPKPTAPAPDPAAILAAGRQRQLAGDLAAAEQSYRRALALGGSGFEAARTALAGLLAAQGRYTEVLATLATLGPAAPVEQWVQRAEAHEISGMGTAAVWDYRDAAHRSDHHTGEEFHARIRYLLDHMEPWQLRQVATDCPFCPEGGYARLRLARQALAQRDLAAAESLLHPLLADFADDPLGQFAARALDEVQAQRAIQPGLYGVLLPLSGPLQPFGERALRGILLASGLFAAEPPPALRLRIYDSRGEPAEAARGVAELARQGVVGIIGPLKGTVSEHAARAARRIGIPLLTLTPSADVGGSGVFRIYLREEDEVAQLVQYAIERRGLQRFAILYPNTARGLRYRDLFWDAVVTRGGVINGVETYDAGNGSKAAGVAIQRLTGVYGLSREEIRERFVAKERQRLQREQELLEALGIFDQTDPAEAAAADTADPNVPATEEVPAAELPPRPLAEVVIDPERLAAFRPEPIVDFEAVFVPVSNLEAGQLAPLFPFYDVEGITLLGIRSWNYSTLIEVGEEYVEGALFPAEFHAATPAARSFFARYRAVYGEDPGIIDAYAYDAASLMYGDRTAPLPDQTRPDLALRLRSVWAASGVTGPLTSHPDGDIAAQPKILTVHNGRVELAK